MNSIEAKPSLEEPERRTSTVIIRPLDPYYDFALWAATTTGLPIDEIVAKAGQYAPAYLGWEIVRRHHEAEDVKRDPGSVFLRTGFEGYFTKMDPGEAVKIQARLGMNQLDALARQYNPNALGRIEQALHRTSPDPQTTLLLESVFRAMLARVRGAMQTPDRLPAIEAFREATQDYARLSSLTIVSQTQIFTFPHPVIDRAPQNIPLSGLDAEGYRAMALIGRFGHPLIRAGIDAIRCNPNVRVY